MTTDIPTSNIFRPRIDWQVKIDQCKIAVQNKTSSREITEVVRFYVMRYFKFDPFLSTQLRVRELATSRAVYCHILAELGMTQENIARLVNKKRSTMVNSNRIVDNLLNTDKYFREQFDLCRQEVYKKIGKKVS